MPLEEGNSKEDVAGEAKDTEQFAVSTLPESVTTAELNERNRAYWEQPGGETFEND